MSEINLNASNFEQEVLKSNIPVLVDFWAPWCGPCRMVAPILSELAIKYEGTVKVAKVNVDEAQDLAISFNVSSIPTMILFKDGKAVAQRVGSANLTVLDSFINTNC